MAPLNWPAVLVPSSEVWNPNAGASRGGGRSISNQEQVVAGPSGYVTASLTVSCNTKAKVLAMRGLLAALDGRAGTVLVGPVEVSRAPWFVDPLTGGLVGPGQGARDAARDPLFSENPETSAVLDYRLATPATLNATTITVQRYHGGPILVGQFLSIGNRLHVVADLPSGDGGIPGPVRVSVRPWLRADYSAGTAVEFGRPVCPMRLASDDTGAMQLDLSRFGTVTLDLVEAF